MDAPGATRSPPRALASRRLLDGRAVRDRVGVHHRARRAAGGVLLGKRGASSAPRANEDSLRNLRNPDIEIGLTGSHRCLGCSMTSGFDCRTGAARRSPMGSDPAAVHFASPCPSPDRCPARAWLSHDGPRWHSLCRHSRDDPDCAPGLIRTAVSYARVCPGRWLRMEAAASATCDPRPATCLPPGTSSPPISSARKLG